MILHFPPPERYSHRRNVSSIPSYRVTARVAENPLSPRRLLSQLWVVVLTVALIFLAADIASADPLKRGTTAPSGITTSTTAAPFSLAAPGTAQLPATASTASAEDDIRDIHGPVHIVPSWRWIAYLLGAIIVGIGLYFLLDYLTGFYRRKDNRPAYQLVLEALDRARNLMKQETLREYSYTVSEIIRIYIEEQFGVKAARSTTEEFLRGLVDKPSLKLAQHAVLLEDFLKHCDLAKFARWKLSQEEMEAMHASAVAFVNTTKPESEDKKSPTQKAALNGATPEKALPELPTAEV